MLDFGVGTRSFLFSDSRHFELLALGLVQDSLAFECFPSFYSLRFGARRRAHTLRMENDAADPQFNVLCPMVFDDNHADANFATHDVADAVTWPFQDPLAPHAHTQAAFDTFPETLPPDLQAFYQHDQPFADSPANVFTTQTLIDGNISLPHEALTTTTSQATSTALNTAVAAPSLSHDWAAQTILQARIADDDSSPSSFSATSTPTFGFFSQQQLQQLQPNLPPNRLTPSWTAKSSALSTPAMSPLSASPQIGLVYPAQYAVTRRDSASGKAKRAAVVLAEPEDLARFPLRVDMLSHRAHTVDHAQTPEGLVTVVRLTRKNETTRNTVLMLDIALPPLHDAKVARIDLVDNELKISFPLREVSLLLQETPDASNPCRFYCRLESNFFNSSSKCANRYWATQRRKTLFVFYSGSVWGIPVYITPRGMPEQPI
jgi:hypothetical protein